MVEYDHSEQLFSIVRDELDERSCEAIELRLGLFDGKKRSYREVGDDLGVTAEAARRLVKRSLARPQEAHPCRPAGELPRADGRSRRRTGR